MMVFGVCLLIAIYLLWVLLIKGALWKLTLGVFGWLGMYWFLSSVPMLHHCPLTFSGQSFSWASIIPTVVVLLALAHTRE
jgi:hypothetical protein